MNCRLFLVCGVRNNVNFITNFFTDSVKSDHVTLMQIDCSVVNTTIVKLKSDALPESLRKKKNNEQGQNLINKRSTYLRRPRVNEDNLSSILHNSSNDISNYPVKFKEPDTSINEVELSKDDNTFAQYLISKYEESKNDSNVSMNVGNKSNNVRNKKNVNRSKEST